MIQQRPQAQDSHLEPLPPRKIDIEPENNG